jgi:tetratricopeptide (TPR) repeat protein
MIVFFCAVLLLSGCTTSKADDTNQKIQEHLIRGNAHFERSDFDQAIAEFTGAIELNPQLAIGYFNRGYAYSRQSDLISALSDMETAISLDPGLASAHWIKGRIYHLDGGKYEQALSSYTRAIDLDPLFPSAFFDRGWAYTGNGAYDRALDDFNKGLELDRDVVYALYGRGWSYANRAQWSQSSYLYLLQHFESDPGRWILYQGTGWSLLKSPLWEYAALPDLSKILVEEPDPITALMNRAFAHTRKAHWDIAIASYSRVLAENPHLERDNYDKAWAEGKRAEWDTVIADYSRILELNPALKAFASGFRQWRMGDGNRRL